MSRLLRILTPYVPWALLLLLLVLIPHSAEAQSVLGDRWDQFLSDVPGFSPNNETGEDLAINFVLNLVRIIRNVIGAVALIMGVIYGLRLVLSQGNEETISKQKTNFLWVFVGFAIMIIAENVAGIFNPESSTASAIIDFNAARDQLRDITGYLKWLLGSVIVLLMSVSSIRMITAGGDEETISTQRKNLIWSGIGMLVILLASNIVNAVYVLNAPDEATAANSSTAITEIAGLVRLILVFMGPAAIGFTIYAGVMYLTALDNEDRAGKARSMIVGGVVGIVIIYAAYAIVNTIISEELASSISLIATSL